MPVGLNCRSWLQTRRVGWRSLTRRLCRNRRGGLRLPLTRPRHHGRAPLLIDALRSIRRTGSRLTHAEGMHARGRASITKTKRCRSADLLQTPRVLTCRLKRRGRSCADPRLPSSRECEPSIAGTLCGGRHDIPDVPVSFHPISAEMKATNGHADSRICAMHEAVRSASRRARVMSVQGQRPLGEGTSFVQKR